MAAQELTSLHLPVDLQGDLVLRAGLPEDADALAEFNGRIHGVDPQDAAGVAALTRDLMNGRHPTTGPADFTVVVERHTGKILSTLCLISQTWSYGGVPFGVGRPELVGTDPEYRGRGLIRRQFEVVHEWSLRRGQVVQVITGIPYYYRQFGYEMALELGASRSVGENMILPLKAEQKELYSFRPLGPGDLPELMACADQITRRDPLACLRDAAGWNYELRGKSAENFDRVQFYAILDSGGATLGFLGVPAFLWKNTQALTFYELKAGVSYLQVTPAVLRWLWALGQARSGEKNRCQMLNIRLGSQHPAYCAINPNLATALRPYAYYMRVADVCGFLKLIRPVLEQRLAASACAGHSGEYKIGFYRHGLRLVLDKGKISQIEPVRLYWDQYQAHFPDLTFLQLLFQYRSLEELRSQYTDLTAAWELHALLDVLFPKASSNVWAVT